MNLSCIAKLFGFNGYSSCSRHVNNALLNVLLLPIMAAFFSATSAAQSNLPSTPTPAAGSLSVSSASTTGPKLQDRSLGDILDNLGRVYRDESNQVLQELWLLGRFHGQYHWTEASTGSDTGYETRRFRLGGQARMFKRAIFHAQMVSGSDIDPFYNGFTELWGQWSFSPEVALTIGQQKHRFTHDRNVSSRYLNYLERSMLTNMFGADYTPAITLQGKVKDLTYYTGFFTNATGQNMGKAFTDFDSGYSFLSAAYYDLGRFSSVDNLTLHATYVHSDANENATNFDTFENGISSAVILTRGHTSLVTEVTGGIGSERGNALGLNLQPSYFITREWQLATRYQLARSNDAQGLNAQRRYERAAGLGRGDLYQAGYLGVNYYIAKHRLKLMTGIEYANMSGEHAWTASTMVRFYFGPHSGGAFPMNQILPLDYD
ncbi:MAG: porin [Pseudomonadota bacterium]|jgi:phosphate-selective porin OprO/OprP